MGEEKELLKDALKHLLDDSTTWLDLSTLAQREYHSDMELIKRIREVVV